MIIDTHCHYNMQPLFSDGEQSWQGHWQKAQAHGVAASIVIGVDQESSQRAVAIAEEDTRLKATVGIHPHRIIDTNLVQKSFITTYLPDWKKFLEELLEKNTGQNIVAIGETGLDYFRVDLSTAEGQLERELQQALCIAQVELGNKFGLPVIFHVRDRGETAYKDVLSLIKAEKKNDLPFILHCVSGSLEYIKEALSLGAYISVAGNVTYKTADSIRAIVEYTPQDRLLLETDAPFLPPVPHRGQTCEPWMIQLTAEYVQTNCHTSLGQIYQNTCTVFPSIKRS